MDRKSSHGQIVLPIFYHVDPSHVQNIDGSFKKSFEEHESKRPIHEVNRWKAAFAQVSKLVKWWHIKGDKFDRPETEHIKNIVDYVTQKLMKHQVFLSFRDEDTGSNFTAHLLKALEDKGINIFSNKGDQFSQAVVDSNLSIIVLSVDYASSQSCLAELSDIMDRKDKHEQTVLPVFYHVDPSHVRNLGGSFKASFDDHESNGLHQVQQWKKAFTKAGTLKGWHVEGGKFDRADTKYIKDVVEYVIKKLNSKSRSVSEELVGIDDQKKVILQLIEQEESRVIGLLGMGGIGKTTLAESVYNEISRKFQSRCFLGNVRTEIKNEGMKSVRNKLLSKLLNSKIDIDTRTIDSNFIRERLNNIRVIVVLDDVDDPDQINLMGVKYFGDGSKIIATSRDRQVLKNGGADIYIHDVKALNRTDSLQLFSTFAFKLLNPSVDFRHLSSKFVSYAEGSPLALKVLGSRLYTKSIKEWESEVDRLKQYADPKISQILMSSFDGLNELEKKILLDIACFFKGKFKKEVEESLSCTYKGAVSGMSSLHDKCLIDILPDIIDEEYISMHDMLEEMAKDIICQESKYPGKYSRLWIPKDVYQVLQNNKGTELIEGIKLDMSQTGKLHLHPSVFKNMINLTFIHFYFIIQWGRKQNRKPLVTGVDIDYLSNELRCLWWDYYPFKSLSPSFNAKNLVVLKLEYGNMEQLWNEDDHVDLVNLMEIRVSYSKNLRKIPNLLGAINLKILTCVDCESLVELPCFNHLTSLEILNVGGCENLKKIPDLLGAIKLEFFGCSGCVCLVELHISKLEFLQSLVVSNCEGLISLPELPPYLCSLDAGGCISLERVEFTNHNLYESDSLGYGPVIFSFMNCWGLNQDSIKNIETNAMLQIQYLAQRLVRDVRYQRESNFDAFICCFPGNEISANEFEHLGTKSWFYLKIVHIGRSGSRFLAFAFCLVTDHTDLSDFEFKCKFLLRTASGEEFSSGSVLSHEEYTSGRVLSNFDDSDHVFILFGRDMIVKDNDYEEALLVFKLISREEDYRENVKVKKWGVHVFYVDAESYVVSAPTKTLNFADIYDVESIGKSDFADSDDVESIEKSDIADTDDVESSEKSDIADMMTDDEFDDSFYSADDNFEEVDNDTQKAA